MGIIRKSEREEHREKVRRALEAGRAPRLPGPARRSKFLILTGHFGIGCSKEDVEGLMAGRGFVAVIATPPRRQEEGSRNRWVLRMPAKGINFTALERLMDDVMSHCAGRDVRPHSRAPAERLAYAAAVARHVPTEGTRGVRPRHQGIEKWAEVALLPRGDNRDLSTFDVEGSADRASRQIRWEDVQLLLRTVDELDGETGRTGGRGVIAAPHTWGAYSTDPDGARRIRLLCTSQEAETAMLAAVRNCRTTPGWTLPLTMITKRQRVVMETHDATTRPSLANVGIILGGTLPGSSRPQFAKLVEDLVRTHGGDWTNDVLLSLAFMETPDPSNGAKNAPTVAECYVIVRADPDLAPKARDFIANLASGCGNPLPAGSTPAGVETGNGLSFFVNALYRTSLTNLPSDECIACNTSSHPRGTCKGAGVARPHLCTTSFLSAPMGVCLFCTEEGLARPAGGRRHATWSCILARAKQEEHLFTLRNELLDASPLRTKPNPAPAPPNEEAARRAAEQARAAAARAREENHDRRARSPDRSTRDATPPNASVPPSLPATQGGSPACSTADAAVGCAPSLPDEPAGRTPAPPTTTAEPRAREEPVLAPGAQHAETNAAALTIAMTASDLLRPAAATGATSAFSAVAPTESLLDEGGSAAARSGAGGSAFPPAHPRAGDSDAAPTATATQAASTGNREGDPAVAAAAVAAEDAPGTPTPDAAPAAAGSASADAGPHATLRRAIRAGAQVGPIIDESPPARDDTERLEKLRLCMGKAAEAEGGQLVRMPCDGDCIFHGFGHLAGKTPSRTTQAALRKEAIKLHRHLNRSPEARARALVEAGEEDSEGPLTTALNLEEGRIASTGREVDLSVTCLLGIILGVASVQVWGLLPTEPAAGAPARLQFARLHNFQVPSDDWVNNHAPAVMKSPFRGGRGQSSRSGILGYHVGPAHCDVLEIGNSRPVPREMGQAARRREGDLRAFFAAMGGTRDHGRHGGPQQQ